MEAISSSAFPVTPQTQTSHIRSSQFSNPTTAQSATRSMQQQPLSAPASQESFVSVQSADSSVAPRLQTSSSNVSQLTSYSDLTSPTSSAPEHTYEHRYVTSKPNISRVRTPEEGENMQRTDSHVTASPMSLTSPVSTNGTKRTASGHVKNAPSLPNTPLTATFAGRRSRADSISSTGSKAGELAYSLKTRLGYAMAKVQHGWENKNINEVEQLAAHKLSPHRHSMSHLDYSRRPVSSGLSNGTARLSMYETYSRGGIDAAAYPPSKRHSGTYASLMPPSLPNLAAAPRLQPAPDIRPATSRRHDQPISATQTSSQSNAMSPPRTPINGYARRPPTIRTDTQTAEAERDALQALFQLGSPHTSQFSRPHHSQQSSSQASPLRSEFATPRKVTFARSESNSSAARSSSEGSALETREEVMQQA